MQLWHGIFGEAQGEALWSDDAVPCRRPAVAPGASIWPAAQANVNADSETILAGVSKKESDSGSLDAVGAKIHFSAYGLHDEVRGAKKGHSLNWGKTTAPMDLLSAIRSFIRVAETGSFSVVSRELHVSQPTISRQILLLENHYGVRLFSRTTRSLTLTDDGRTLLDHALNIQNMMEDAHLALSQRQSRVYGHIRLGTPTAFGLYLTRHLPRLLEQHPELSIELVVSDSFGDIVREGIDLAIRVGMCPSGTTITRHLADVSRVLVASPSFLKRNPEPEHPNDLIGLSPVIYTYGGQEPEWVFQKGEQKVRLAMHSAFRTNSSEVVHRGVVQGMGVGLMPLFSVADELRSGALVRLMPEWSVPPIDLHIVYPGPQNTSLRRRTVLNFLLSLAEDLTHQACLEEGMLHE